VTNSDYNVLKSDTTVSSFFKAIDFTPEDLQDLSVLSSCKDLIIDTYLDCVPKRNSLMTLGHVFSSVLTPYFPRKLPPHALFFRGLAGSFKSTFAQLTMGLFYSDPFNIKWPHARDTPYSIEMALSYVDNAPLLLDDIKAERQNAEDVMMIIQSLYDEQGRSRLNRDLTVRKGRAVANQGLVVTGEIIPTNQLSILSRMIQLEFKKSEVDLKAITYLQDNQEQLRKLTPFFIQWLQLTYGESSISLRSFNIPDVKDYEMERTYHQISKMLTGLDCFLSFLVAKTGLSEYKKNKLMIEAEAYAVDLFKANLTRIGSVAKEAVLISEISGYLKTGLFSVWGPQLNAIEVGNTTTSGDVILCLVRLRTGLTQRGMMNKASKLDQVFVDLVYQGKCKKLSNTKYLFPKDILLGEDYEFVEELNSDDTDTHTTSTSGRPPGLNG
jgi:hypothetical protein